MTNIEKIKKISAVFYIIMTLALVLVPIYYGAYWILINDFPASLIQNNGNPADFIQNKLSLNLKLTGFAVSVLPMISVSYIFFNLRKLFNLYRKGNIFSFEHVGIFKRTARGMILWVFFSIVYESCKTIIFSFNNPPGSRFISVGFGSSELTLVIITGIIFLISWVMDEAGKLDEENRLTI